MLVHQKTIRNNGKNRHRKCRKLCETVDKRLHYAVMCVCPCVCNAYVISTLMTSKHTNDMLAENTFHPSRSGALGHARTKGMHYQVSFLVN